MKYYNILLLAFVLSFAQVTEAHDFFTFEKKNIEYKLKNGLLNGDFLQKYPDGTILASGTFANNQRVGTWNFYSVTGKLIEKRLYFNNYEYAVMKKNSKTWKQFDTNGDWDLIKEQNVKFQQRVCKYASQAQDGFLEIDKLVKIVNSNKAIQLFTDGRFTNTLEKMNLTNIVGIKIKEDFIYDNEREVMYSRPIGIGFVNANNQTVAWLYYPEWIDIFKDTRITWHNDHTGLKTMYDVFTQRAYPANLCNEKENTIQQESITELELEFVHIENMFIVAKA